MVKTILLIKKIELYNKFIGYIINIILMNYQQKIENKYSSYENFFNILKLKSLKLKGSGYTFLVLKTTQT